MKNLPGFRYAWLILLGAALALSAYGSYRHATAVKEYAYGCDSFGYLQSAHEIRTAVARGERPRFNIEAAHTRLLIDFLRSQNLPSDHWDELVAPHAHHYFPQSGQVAVQYPPGTGMMMALFPRGKALHKLDTAVVLIFLITGVAALVIAGFRQAWAAAGCVVFALEFGLAILGRMESSSFSINALLVPLLLAVILLCISLRLRRPGANGLASPGLSLVAGLCFGFSILIRVPVLFLLPGFLLLLLPAVRHPHLRSTAIAFILGVTLGGFLPLAAHQQQVTGAWYLPTYNSGDNAPPSLEAIRTNLAYYFGNGDGSRENWGLWVAAAGFAGLAVLRRKTAQAVEFHWKLLAGAALTLWGISSAYFLSHRVITPYYQIPANFAAVALLMAGAFLLEISHAAAGAPEPVRRKPYSPLLLLGFLPGIAALWPLGTTMFHRTHYPPRGATRTCNLDPELLDPKAWLFADFLTGTIYYYAQQPAFKTPFSGPDTRRLVFQFVASRGEPLYMICDSPSMRSILNEIVRMGGIPEQRGLVAHDPYYLIHWPTGGPKAEAALETR